MSTDTAPDHLLIHRPRLRSVYPDYYVTPSTARHLFWATWNTTATPEPGPFFPSRSSHRNVDEEILRELEASLGYSANLDKGLAVR